MQFQRLPAPSDEDVCEVVADVALRIGRVLKRHGLHGDSDTPEWALTEAGLVQACEGSLSGRAVFGATAGDRPRAVGKVRESRWVEMRGRRCAQLEGFSLHANVAVPAGDRDRLEQLCRYLLRPSLSHQRLELLSGGRVRLKLKTPWSDGTSHLEFTAWELFERLASLIPRPRANLIRYHGCFAPNSKWRREVVPEKQEEGAKSEPAARGRHWISWSSLLRRVFEIEVLVCADCGGKCQLVSVIDGEHQGEVVTKILASLRGRSPPAVA